MVLDAILDSCSQNSELKPVDSSSGRESSQGPSSQQVNVQLSGQKNQNDHKTNPGLPQFGPGVGQPHQVNPSSILPNQPQLKRSDLNQGGTTNIPQNNSHPSNDSLFNTPESFQQGTSNQRYYPHSQPLLYPSIPFPINFSHAPSQTKQSSDLMGTSQDQNQPYSQNPSVSNSPYFVVNPILANAYHAALDAITKQEQQTRGGMGLENNQEGLKSIDYAKKNMQDRSKQDISPSIEQQNSTQPAYDSTQPQTQRPQDIPWLNDARQSRGSSSSLGQDLFQQLQLQQQMSQVQMGYMPQSNQNYAQPYFPPYQAHLPTTQQHLAHQQAYYYPLQHMPSHYMNLGMGFVPVQIDSQGAQYQQHAQVHQQESLYNAPQSHLQGNPSHVRAWNLNMNDFVQLMNRGYIPGTNLPQGSHPAQEQSWFDRHLESLVSQGNQINRGIPTQPSPSSQQQQQQQFLDQQGQSQQQPQRQQNQQQIVRDQINHLQNNIQGQGQPQGRVYHYVVHINLRFLRNLAFQLFVLLASLYIVGAVVFTIWGKLKDHTPWTYMLMVVGAFVFVVIFVAPPIQYFLRGFLGDFPRGAQRGPLQQNLAGQGVGDVLQVVYDYLLRISNLQRQLPLLDQQAQANQANQQQNHTPQQPQNNGTNNSSNNNNSGDGGSGQRSAQNPGPENIGVTSSLRSEQPLGQQNQNVTGAQNISFNETPGTNNDSNLFKGTSQQSEGIQNRGVQNGDAMFGQGNTANSNIGSNNQNRSGNDGIQNVQAPSSNNAGVAQNNTNNTNNQTHSQISNFQRNLRANIIAYVNMARQSAFNSGNENIRRSQSYTLINEIWRALMAFILSLFPHWNFNNDDAALFAQAQQQQDVNGNE